MQHTDDDGSPASFWRNLRLNSGLATDPAWRKFVRKWSLISLALICVSCCFSHDYFQYDEHYQIVEFVSYKLGKTPRSELAWEFQDQIRPWLQPATYYAAAKLLTTGGVENPFHLATTFRAMSAALSFAAIVLLMLSANVLFPDDGRRRAVVVLLALLWLIPYLAVRTSSETWSGDLFTFGLAALILGSSSLPRPDGAERHARNYPWSAMVLAGLCFGLAFECRYQIAFAAAGVMAWLLVFMGEPWSRRIGKLAAMTLAIAVPIALGTLADRWGYGEWTIAPWNYFYANIVKHAGNQFGTDPWWWYFVSMSAHPVAPITLVWTLAMLASWWRYPRHLLTWATAPFFIVHSIVAHKEARFLFPLAMVSVYFFVLGIGPIGLAEMTERDEAHGANSGRATLLRSRIRRWLGWSLALPNIILRSTWLWDRRNAWPVKALFALNFVAMACACLVPKRPGLEVQKFVYEHYPQGCQAYLLSAEDKNPYQNMHVNSYFYRPPGFSLTKVASYADLQTVSLSRSGSCVLITDQLAESPELAAALPEAHMIYRSFPAWVEHYDVAHWLRRTHRFSLYEVDPALSQVARIAPNASQPKLETAGRAPRPANKF